MNDDGLDDNLNEVIAMLMQCGLVGSVLTIQVDTDHLPAWGMHIATDGNQYFLAPLDSGGYMLQAAVSLPQALVTSGPHGEVIGVIRDPEQGICQEFLVELTTDRLRHALRELRLTLKAARGTKQSPHNNN